MTEATNYWEKDLLGRKQDAEFLYNFLIGQLEKRKNQGRIGSYVMNVDADWGGGKTFFLDGFASDLEAKEHIVVRINAWRDDHAQDPYVAIMAAIDNAFAPFIEKPGKIKSAWTTAKASGGAIALRTLSAIGKGLIKKHTGVSVDELGALVSEDVGDAALDAVKDGAKVAEEQIEKLFDKSLEALIEGFQKADKAITTFREKMTAVIEATSDDRKTPVFILVDELDRCRPTYAVQLLERVKHLFDVQGVVFVFATNADQLQHSIQGAYGAGFDGFRYLKRFFDRTYVFDKPLLDQLVATLCADLPVGKIRAPEGKIDEAIAAGCHAMNLDLRAIHQVMEIIDSTISAWPHTIPADISLLFPLCVYFYRTGNADWPSIEQVPGLRNWHMARWRRRPEGGAIDDSYSFIEIYDRARQIFGSMRMIVDSRSSQSYSRTDDYVSAMFEPEWNGRRIDYEAPSIQMQLSALVANAGRISSQVET